ncbi:MAG: hypothetical protein IJP89_04525 [Synergistaceae bacterium]|nr:hypothetical protein [Synergistaceae bacterium]
MRKVEYYDKIQRLRLIDDVFMSEAFKDIPCVELMLKVILGRDDVHVLSVKTQKILQGWGRTLRLDVWGNAELGTFNTEFQRSNDGADIRRARLHSSTLDYFSLDAGQKFRDIPDSYVIFITEHDFLKGNKPLYTIERCIMETGEKFNDGSHIIYVNGSCRDGKTALGRLMQDLFEPDPSKMNYSVLAERSRYLKEGDGIEIMSETIRELFKDEIAAGRAEKEGSFITNLLKLGRLAFSEIAQCAGVPLSRVQDIANSLGIHES